MYIDFNMKLKFIAFMLYKYNISKNKQLKLVKLINYIVELYNNIYLQNSCQYEVIVNDRKLDLDQIKAIYADEINNLIIAGAGSGKTLTIVGKINYLIEQRNFKVDEIICFSFTNEACNNLLSRLKYPVKVFTFHKFALKFISNKKICNDKLDYVINEYFSSIILNSKIMMKKVIKCLNNANGRCYVKYLHSKELSNFKLLIKQFINNFKSNGYDFEHFLVIKKRKYKNFISIVIDIYTLYIEELKACGEVDLDMLIIEASRVIKNLKLPYKYIIIDEFQDISYIRYNLVKSIVDASGAKLMAVGDDYQSIYKFSGCSMKLLYQLYDDKLITKVIKLENNYRCCQEVVNISTKFILKNKIQIKKKIVSNKSILKPIFIVKEQKDILEKLLNYILDDDILILGRNNDDIYKYISNNMHYNNGCVNNNDNKKIVYKTVHSAKGLEANCVIMINLTDEICGFPSKIKNEKIIDYVFTKENYKYAEERRLFYVALTRTKGNIYMLYPSKPSVFLKEIIKDNKNSINYLKL